MKKNILENAGHGSLGHRIFCILRDKILNEEYEKGQKLNEVVLSKELNISLDDVVSLTSFTALYYKTPNPSRGYLTTLLEQFYTDIIEPTKSELY